MSAEVDKQIEEKILILDNEPWQLVVPEEIESEPEDYMRFYEYFGIYL